MSLKFLIIEHGSPSYDETVQLRYNILREPLGLHFTREQLAAEDADVHIGCYSEEGELVGCLVLVLKEDQKLKMRQVAVAESHQKKGIGKELVLFSEKWGQENGYKLMYCHARDYAAPFYLKLKYRKVGEPFEEVTIKHWYMEKDL